jgi:hypothetical protein
MQSALAPKLRSVIAQHLEEATPEELAQVVGSLAGNGRGHGTANNFLSIGAPARPALGFQKLGADGREILDPQDGEHVSVRDRATGLIWSRSTLPGGRMNHERATKACADLTLMGFTDWRLPTIKELLSIVDYTRHQPAIDASLFDCESSWYWTSTPCAWNPAGAAWVVGFDGGSVGYLDRGYEFYVRAVRSGQ